MKNLLLINFKSIGFFHHEIKMTIS